MRVRRAGVADLPAMVDTLVAAHLDYEWERWLLPRRDRAGVLRELIEADLSLIGLPSGEAWVAGDGGVDSVAVWLSPENRPDVAAVARLDALAGAALGQRRPLVEAVEAAIAARRPVEPHWSLTITGTRPFRQRRGLGQAVLAPVLARLDDEGLPACCETSAAANVAFYATVGFCPVARLADLPGGAPVTWVLWREPGGTGSGRRATLR